jgi:hypothetical protein
MCENPNAYSGYVGKTEEKRLLATHKRRWWIILKWIFKK